MTAKEVLIYLARRIHTTVLATADAQGLPVTAAVDMMDADENGLYFLTARGKSLYDRLSRGGFAALTGIEGADTMHSVAVSVRGNVREIGSGRLKDLFEKNPYMRTIYPTEESRRALTVFCLYAGTGEWFDLSRRPIERFSFTFGGAADTAQSYSITDACSGCGACAAVCPQECIYTAVLPAVIRQEHCLHCGNCMRVCPSGAVVRGAAAGAQ